MRSGWPAIALSAAAVGCGGPPPAPPDLAAAPDLAASPDLAPPPTVYHALSDLGRWAAFDMTTVHPAARGCQGSAFDGRYLYLAPILSGVVVRYDTSGPFADRASWAAFDVAAAAPGARGFVGAIFDGRYVYFVPFDNGAPSGLAARYDTRAPFTAAPSWATFDLGAVDPAAKGFIGGAFDGRHLYFVPFRRGPTYHGTVARFDTLAPFAQPGSWSTFDLAGLHPNARGYAGAAFDGRYLYLAPSNHGGMLGSIVARLDTKGPFRQAASWSTFDSRAVGANARGFQGAAFDGRHVHLVPWFSSGSLVTRYDTAQPFDRPASWATFDTLAVDPRAKGFVGAAFDGRHVYLAPYDLGAGALVTRVDTEAPFAARASWSGFDLTAVHPSAGGFGGGGFDGRYVYLVPETNGTIVRFDAKSPPSLPPRIGSFM